MQHHSRCFQSYIIFITPILPLTSAEGPLPWLSLWPSLWPLSKSAHSFLFPDPIMLTILSSLPYSTVPVLAEPRALPQCHGPPRLLLELSSLLESWCWFNTISLGKTVTGKPRGYSFTKDFAKSPRFGSLRLYTSGGTSSWIQARCWDSKLGMWVKGISWISVTEKHWLLYHHNQQHKLSPHSKHKTQINKKPQPNATKPDQTNQTRTMTGQKQFTKTLVSLKVPLCLWATQSQW